MPPVRVFALLRALHVYLIGTLTAARRIRKSLPLKVRGRSSERARRRLCRCLPVHPGQTDVGFDATARGVVAKAGCSSQGCRDLGRVPRALSRRARGQFGSVDRGSLVTACTLPIEHWRGSTCPTASWCRPVAAAIDIVVHLGLDVRGRRRTCATRPCRAVDRSGSVSATWWSMPAKVYRPSARRFGQGTSAAPE